MKSMIYNNSDIPVVLPPVFGNAVLASGAYLPVALTTYSNMPKADLDALVALALTTPTVPQDGNFPFNSIVFPGLVGLGILAGLQVTPALTYVINTQEPTGQVVGTRVYSITDNAFRELVSVDPDVWVTVGRDVWRDVANLNVQRLLNINIALPQRKMLALTGIDVNFENLSTSESFDLSKSPIGQWSDVAVCPIPQASWCCVLKDGRVLVCGGDGSLFAPNLLSYIYDAKLDTWTQTGDMPACTNPGANLTRPVVLKDGKVLVAGGYEFVAGSFVGSDLSMIFDPKVVGTGGHMGKWDYTRNGAMAQTKLVAGTTHHDLILLKDGRVLCVGGTADPSNTNDDTAQSVQIWTQSTGVWTAPGGAQLPVVSDEGAGDGRQQFRLMAIPDGRILAAGGYSVDGGITNCRKSAFTFDPGTDTWTRVGDLPVTTSFALYGRQKTGGGVYVLGGRPSIFPDEVTLACSVFDAVDDVFAEIRPLQTIGFGLPEVYPFGWGGDVLSSGEFLVTGGIFDFLSGSFPGTVRTQLYVPGLPSHALITKKSNLSASGRSAGLAAAKAKVPVYKRGPAT